MAAGGVAGRRSRDTPGPDQAPRNDSLDVRWSPDFRYIVTTNPQLRSPLLRCLRDAWDQGHRAQRNTPNPLLFDPDIAGHDDDPRPRANLIGVPVDKITPYLKAIVAFITPGVIALVGAVQDASPGGSNVIGPEWVGILAACVITGGAVWATPNLDPKGIRQNESVQPAADVYDPRHNID